MCSAMWEFHGIMLTAEDLVRRRTKLDIIIPTKGPKCFTPSGSWLETKQLQTLLDASKALIAEERVERENALAQAEWDENLKVARVTRIVGRQFEKFGHEENMTIFLYPEEALYLLETNHLQLLFGGVSMSIQQAYTVLLGTKTGCNFVEYMVFSHLLKNGFKILRHCAKRTVTRYERLIGLHLEQPRNRKSRRKCSVNENENSCESDNKQIKTDKKIQTKNEKETQCNKVDLQLVPSELKQTSPEKVCDVLSVGVTTDNHSSGGSDIEILSERNVCSRSEEMSDYTEYSSSSSEEEGEDSDCQVIEEINSEKSAPQIGMKKFSSENKVIEEIDLSDSESSNVACCNMENPSIIKNEVACEIELCDITELKENMSLQDEQSISNVSCDSENDVNRNSSRVERFVSETSDLNDSCDVGQTNSNQLMESESVSQEAVVEPTVEENNITAAAIGNEKQMPEYDSCKEMSECISVFSDVKEESCKEMSECISVFSDVKEESCKEMSESISVFSDVKEESCKEMSECISVFSDVKEESCSSLSAPLSRESVIQLNNAVSCKKEIDNVVVLTYHHKKEEIEVIDLDDENSESSVFEDRNTILQSFPNVAGCHVIRCNVPPQRLCPPNVCPSQQTYNIDLERLQDPRYGGNPKKQLQQFLQKHANFSDERYQHQYERHGSANQNNIFRYNTDSNRLCNRYNNDNNNQFPDERNERWHDFQNQSRSEGFSDYSRFGEHPVYPNFQSGLRDQSDQNSYPHFSGQPLHNLAPYHHTRTNFRSRGNPNREIYPQNSPFQNCRFRGSRVRRFPRRRGRGGRNMRGVSYSVARDRDREHNESFDEVGGNYVPFNVENTRSSYVQSRNTRQNTHGEKRHRKFNEENSNSSCSREKRPRRTRGNYFPPTRNSHDLLQFLDIIHPDATESANSGPVVSSGSCDNNQSDHFETGQNASAFAETESTGDSSSRRNSCSDSCSSEDSSEDSVNGSYGNETEDSVSVLLKSDNLGDIDTCLKSLEIVRSVKFKGLAAESGEPLLSIKYDLYQPSTPFRRSNPPVPDFRVVVMRPDQNLPTSRQLAFLGEGFEDDVPLLFAIASTDSVAFYLQSVVDLPTVSEKEKIQGK